MTGYNDDGSRCCHNQGGVHIPGCMGCAAMGHHACTCRPVSASRLEERVAELERAVKQLLRVAPPERAGVPMTSLD